MNRPPKTLQDYMDARKAEEQSLRDKYGADFDKPSNRKFGITLGEERCIEEWYSALKPEILAIQKESSAYSGIRDIIDNDEPYYGAVGGGLTYSFIPTSLGTILTVTESITGKKLNVTDALGWYLYG